MLNRIKKVIKNVSENKKFKIEENKKIINIVERIVYFRQLLYSLYRLKKLTKQLYKSLFGVI